MTRFKILLAALCVAAVMAIPSAAQASTSQPTVYHNSPFTYNGYGGEYAGVCTLFVYPESVHGTCHFKLVSGTPVSSVTTLEGPGLRGVLLPSGRGVETF